MESEFCGQWKNLKTTFEIKNKNKTFHCTIDKENIGILFEDVLIVSEFGEEASVGGIGVYSPIGDGNSYYVLWSSNSIEGILGSGIALKTDGIEGFQGSYSVRRFVESEEAGIFSVVLTTTKNKDIYRLSWMEDGQEVLHGIGYILDGSLVFAWGSADCDFDFTLMRLEATQKNVIYKNTIKMKDISIERDIYTKIKA